MTVRVRRVVGCGLVRHRSILADAGTRVGRAVCTCPLVHEPLSPDAAAQLAVSVKALADPIRLRLMSLIASHEGGEACVCDVSIGTELSQSTISHHLKVLRTAGLLTSERRASWVYYRVEPGALERLSQLLEFMSVAAMEPR